MRAFQNNIQLKETTVNAIRGFSEECLTPVILTWDGQKGSIVGNLLQSQDVAGWEGKFGLPKWFALTLDTFCAQTGGLETGKFPWATSSQIGARLMEAIPVGAGLQGSASQLLAYLLIDKGFGVLGMTKNEDLRKALVKISSMHSPLPGTGEPSREEWKLVRRLTSDLTNSISDKLDGLIGACAEAACWDYSNSPTVVSDTLTCWFRVHEVKAVMDYGWSDEDDAQVRARLDSLFQEAIKTIPEEEINVFDLYEQHFSAEATRTRGMFIATKSSRALALKSCTDTMQHYLKT